jgi:hypothetical protein
MIATLQSFSVLPVGLISKCITSTLYSCINCIINNLVYVHFLLKSLNMIYENFRTLFFISWTFVTGHQQIRPAAKEKCNGVKSQLSRPSKCMYGGARILNEVVGRSFSAENIHTVYSDSPPFSSFGDLTLMSLLFCDVNFCKMETVRFDIKIHWYPCSR